MLVEHLQKTFAERTRSNPQYSLRAYARSLQIDSSTLSAILRRKRPLSAKMAQRLIARLDINDPSKTQMLLLGTLGATDGDLAPKYTELDLAASEVISSWEHFAIMALLQCDRFRADYRTISRRLNIPIALVIEALHRLEKLGLVKNESSTWVLTGKNLATPQNVPNVNLRKTLRQNIEKALESLERDPVEVRDVSGMTMAIDAKKLPEAKKLIQDFRRRLSVFLEHGSKNSVYRLNIQLFPLTQEEPK